MRIFKSLIIVSLVLPNLVFAKAQLSGKTTFKSTIDNQIAPAPLADFTMMVYMGADNNLSDFSTLNLEQMTKAGTPQSMNITFMQDTEGNHGIKLGYVKKNELVYSPLSEINSADPRNIESFIKWSVKVRPAKKYMLVLWDHGSGWMNISAPYRDSNEQTKNSKLPKKAIVTDDGYDGKHPNEVSIFQIKTLFERLKAQNIKIDILAFDACLMAMAEIIYDLSPYVDMMIASEETIPGYGWPYENILRKMNRDFSNTTIGKTVVNEYINFYQNEINVGGATLSAVDTKKFANFSNTTLRKVFTRASGFMTKDMYKEISLMSPGYTFKVYKDLGRMLALIPTPDAQNAIEQYKKSIIANGATSHEEVKFSTGISIYMPAFQMLKPYYGLAFPQATGFINLVAKGVNGKVNGPTRKSLEMPPEEK